MDAQIDGSRIHLAVVARHAARWATVRASRTQGGQGLGEHPQLRGDGAAAEQHSERAQLVECGQSTAGAGAGRGAACSAPTASRPDPPAATPRRRRHPKPLPTIGGRHHHHDVVAVGGHQIRADAEQPAHPLLRGQYRTGSRQHGHRHLRGRIEAEVAQHPVIDNAWAAEQLAGDRGAQQVLGVHHPGGLLNGNRDQCHRMGQQ